MGKLLNRGETLFGSLSQGAYNHLLDLYGQILTECAQGGRRVEPMLHHDLHRGAREGAVPCQPFISHHRERILVASRLGLAVALLRGDISWCSSHILQARSGTLLHEFGNAKIAE